MATTFVSALPMLGVRADRDTASRAVAQTHPSRKHIALRLRHGVANIAAENPCIAQGQRRRQDPLQANAMNA
jgi:hypothetical protein